jgi:AcrR family transcriptional regulator
MVMTPWGDSASLRARRLRPGPGQTRAEVEQNQRERLYGAMIALVAEKGYEATTLADLAELSGVSSRSFYGLFESKRACFAETLQNVIMLSVGIATQIGNDPQLGGWEEQARAGSHAFAEMVVAQPAAAKACLIESYAAGPDVVAPLEAAITGFEALARAIIEHSPERAAMPPEMITAYTGGVEEMVRMRLVAGEEEFLPDLIDQTWDLIGSYVPPPEPLRLAERVPASGKESLDAHDNAERVIRAFAVEAAERGYAATTVAHILSRAQMSATTFYDQFGGKEEAMLAAIDSAGAHLAAAMRPAMRRAPDWPAAVRAAIGGVFNFLASRPALAHLVLVDAYVAGPMALQRRVGYLQPLEALLAEGREMAPEAPEITSELMSGVFFSLSRRRINEDGPQALPALAPLCTYLALAPYLGADAACETANSYVGRRRDQGAPR